MSKIRQVYFYVVSLVGLLMIVFPTADLINQGLKTWVFPQIDEAEYAHLKRPMYPPEVQAPKETPEQEAIRLKDEQEFAELQRRAQKQRDLVRDISLLIVGLPLFAFHFRIVQKEKNRD